MEDTRSKASYTTMALAVWLILSAYLWPHTQQQVANEWIVGALALVFSLASLRYPTARYLNAVLGVWLFISAWALPAARVGTIWNNALIGIAMFALSLAPAYVDRGPRPTVRG